MPSGLPSSFASAAAGQTARDPRGNGQTNTGRGAGSGEWPRANGTRTFRRASTTPFNQNSASNPGSVFTEGMPNSVSDMSSYSANHQPAYADSPGDMRYSREQLMDIYKNTDLGQIDAASLYTPTWDPAHVNGNQSSRPWGKTGETGHIPQDPTVCWAAEGNVKPIGLEPLSAEEREILSTDVNSTLKPPQPKQPQQQEGSVQQQQGGGINGRKASLSAGNYPLASPSTSRPVTRRRETADTNPFPSAAGAGPGPGAVASPTANRFAREDSWFARRSTELNKDSTITDEPEEDTNIRETPSRSQPNYGLLRSNTGGSTSAFNNTSSLWGPGTPTSTSGLGAFGSFALPTPGTADKRFQAPGTGSRLAHLLPGKEAGDSATPKANDVANWRPRQRTDTDPFGGDDSVSGSAVLGGARDTSPPATASGQQPQRGGVFDTPVKGNAGDFGMAGLNLGERGDGPNSPSETNPYRSPMGGDRGHEAQDDHHDLDRVAQPPAAAEQHSGYSTLPRSFGATPFDGSDRSQTSSVGAKGFPTQANPLTGWPAASVGTPDRERSLHNPFGSSIFSPLDNLPSPGMGGLGGVFGGNPARMGRGRLESLFPPAMQAEMHAHEHDNHVDPMHDPRQANLLGAIGRGAIGLGRESTGSPIRAGRGIFDDHFSHPEATRSPFSTTEPGHLNLNPTASGQSFPSTGGPSAPPTQPASDPTAVRTMVMPDRMRWVYMDPQGTIQGPFNGLEMNDWYKANFFTPDLRVRRVEDSEFEPLGQLIRRIGNSREPFLVPQMGIAHGPPPSAPFTGGGSEPVPPLQSAFPSFGRTLTAQQQNDLERRKQEEQLFHARQREMAQTFVRLPLQTSTLHHHSSLHSLHSQPSFGSMTSPIAMPPQPPIGPLAPGAPFFDTAVGMVPGPVQAPIGPSADLFPSDLNMGERQVMANLQAGGLPGVFHSQPGHGVDSGLHSQLPHIDQLQQDEEGFDARLRQFHDIRAQRDAEDAAAVQATQAVEKHEKPVTREEELPVAPPAPVEPAVTEDVGVPESAVAKKTTANAQQELSLTEKVRKTQADQAKSSQQPPVSGLPMPFPPPQTTPLAAPTAQRPASNLPNRYGDRSASGTPDTTSDGAPLAPPPTAPWAPQPGAETHKGPSLREIQEAEAKKAAKKEEAVAAARRAALEIETAALREREKAAAVLNTGLPATSTWGTGSPVSAPTGSPWKQPVVVKAPVTNNAGSKKTLADIQREEEQRKLKAKEVAQQASAVSGAALGKRYADLASKSSAPPGMATANVAAAVAAATIPAPVGGGWSTVGAGGKVKVPTGPSQIRAASTTGVKAAPSPVAPKATPKPAVTSLKDARNQAIEEFKKWIQRDLTRNGISESQAEDVTPTLLEMPQDSTIIAEIVYGMSTTINGRHFAEEFIRRKKLADKGIIEKEPAGLSAASETKTGVNGGWNEVAKKGGNGVQAPKEEVPGFKIVPSKKNKGKK